MEGVGVGRTVGRSVAVGEGVAVGAGVACLLYTSANDHLGGLPGRDELGRVAVSCQGVAVFLDAVPDEPHV